MTTHDLVNSPTTKLVVYAALIGIAWASLRAEVAQKADKAEVAAYIATAASAAAAAATANAAEQALMAADIRDIKAILCSRPINDSYCSRKP